MLVTPEKSHQVASVRVRLLSSRSNKLRSAALSTRVELGALEAQLVEERKAREKLQSELEELKRLSMSGKRGE